MTVRPATSAVSDSKPMNEKSSRPLRSTLMLYFPS